jgi:hypothetical protein
MPSRDESGRRLPGNAQRRQARRSAAGMEPEPDRGVPLELAELEEPPVQDGAEACLSWANDVLLRAAAAALEPQADMARLGLITYLGQRIGQLKDKAQQSEMAVQVRLEREGVEVELGDPERPPYGDALAANAWCYFRLCHALYEVCRLPFLHDELRLRYQLLGKTLAAVGFVREKHETTALVDRSKEEGQQVREFNVRPLRRPAAKA